MSFNLVTSLMNLTLIKVEKINFENRRFVRSRLSDVSPRFNFLKIQMKSPDDENEFVGQSRRWAVECNLFECDTADRRRAAARWRNEWASGPCNNGGTEASRSTWRVTFFGVPPRDAHGPQSTSNNCNMCRCWGRRLDLFLAAGGLSGNTFSFIWYSLDDRRLICIICLFDWFRIFVLRFIVGAVQVSRVLPEATESALPHGTVWCDWSTFSFQSMASTWLFRQRLDASAASLLRIIFAAFHSLKTFDFGRAKLLRSEALTRRFWRMNKSCSREEMNGQRMNGHRQRERGRGKKMNEWIYEWINGRQSDAIFARWLTGVSVHSFFLWNFSFIASPFVCWLDLQTVGLHLGPALHLFFIFDGSATFSATFTAL